MSARLKPQRWHRRSRRPLRIRIVLVLLAAAAMLFAAILLRPHVHGRIRGVALPILRHYQKTAWLLAGAAWTPAQAARLHRELNELAGSDAFPASTGILVLDGRNGRVMYSRNPRLPLVPGSTVKLITAAAALGELEPGHRFTTSIVADKAQENGTLSGSIWLVGGGDPELTSDDLRSGVRHIQLSGVESISGNVYADGSRYGPDQVSAGWQAEDLQYGWAAPASALSIDGGSVQFTITPRAGLQADVAVDPPGHRVIASVDTVDAGAENTLRIDPLPDGGYEVRGQIPYGAPQKYWRAVAHPTRAAAISLLAMLQLAGIEVWGAAAEGGAPAQSSVLWEHRSRTLDLIVKQMFLLSDNHYAEELLRAVGWKMSGRGDLHSSLAAERAFMRDNAIPTQEAALADGSGLSTQNKVSAQTLAATLRFLLNEPMPEPAFTLLPRAGIEGTVSVRQLSPQAKGRVFAKDGYIEGASAIAGYVLSMHHGPLIFVFLVNDWQRGLDAVWADEDRMLDLLALM